MQEMPFKCVLRRYVRKIQDLFEDNRLEMCLDRVFGVSGRAG